eukprot:302603-Pleurochrysis_carterae.AAC.2
MMLSSSRISVCAVHLETNACASCAYSPHAIVTGLAAAPDHRARSSYRDARRVVRVERRQRDRERGRARVAPKPVDEPSSDAAAKAKGERCTRRAHVQRADAQPRRRHGGCRGRARRKQARRAPGEETWQQARNDQRRGARADTQGWRRPLDSLSRAGTRSLQRG